ncbi:MAG: crossover junction endodeoxyribonuclease RuvC [Acidobacteriota bacterium]
MHFGKYFGYLDGVPAQFYMRVLGIDPGSETLGWGVVEGSGLKYAAVDFGVVKSDPRQAFSKRLANIYDGVSAVIEDLQPDVVSIEEAFYAVNVKVALKLGQVRGVLLLLAEQRGLAIAEYAPRLIKQTVVGYGNAEKHQVQEMVRVLLRMKSAPTPHDASDALAMAICHFHHAGMRDKIDRSVKKIP